MSGMARTGRSWEGIRGSVVSGVGVRSATTRWGRMGWWGRLGRFCWGRSNARKALTVLSWSDECEGGLDVAGRFAGGDCGQLPLYAMVIVWHTEGCRRRN